MSIINSLLDTDFYKLTMGQFAFHFKPNTPKVAEFSMKCRSGQDLLFLKKEIENEINHWLSLKLTESELNYLKTLEVNNSKVFKDDYIEFLRTLDLKNNISVKVLEENGQLNIRVKGEWQYSIYAEVPFLAIVQELYWKNNLSSQDYTVAEIHAEANLQRKIKFLNTTNIKFAEFGTRRRFSYKLQQRAVNAFKSQSTQHLIGTSNVLFAMETGLTPIGSQAHEYFQAMQRLSSSFENSQKEALEAWLVEYPDKLKIALTDILGTDMFLLDFNKDLSESYSGTRQDSGDPKEWGYKMKNHYESLGINPKNKTILFSDDLNFQKADVLDREFNSVFNVIFGIGTFCSNDTNNKPVSLVMKMVRMNNEPVIKVSDSPGKVMCEDESFIKQTEKLIKQRTLQK